MKSMSIKSKIIISLVGLCLLILISISFIIGSQVHTNLKTKAKEDLVSTVSQKTEQYNLIFKRLAEELNIVEIYASNLLLRNEILSTLNKPMLMPWQGEGTGSGANRGYGSIELNSTLAPTLPKLQRIGKLLEGVGSGNDLITLAYFVSPEGVFVADDNEATASIGTNEAWIPANRPWYKAAIEAGNTAWTEPYVDANSKNLVVTVAKPIYNKEELLGVVAFDVLLKTLKDDVLSMDIDYDGYSLLIGNNGKVLVSPDVANNPKNWDKNYETEDLLNTSNAGLNTVVRQMVQQKTGLGEYQENNEGNRYLAYAPLEGLDASVGIVVSEKEVVAPAFDILKWIALIAGGLSIFAILMGILLGNSISKPIIKLTDLANDISGGKAQLSTLEMTRTDEIGHLTEAFNRLISSLKIAMEMK